MNQPDHPETGSLRPLDVLLTALWLGLLAGIGEGLYVRLGRLVHLHTVLVGPGITWMAPLGDTLWMLPPGLAFAFLVALAPRVPARAIVGALVFMASVALLLVFDRLHTYAALIIALGLGVQGSRLILRHTAGFSRMVRRSLPVLAAVVALAALSEAGLNRWRESRALATEPAAPAGAPNVVLLILDTVRSLSVSMDGFNRPTTPRLEALAGQGVRFARAWSPSAWTLPSHASMFTGLYPHQLSAGYRTPLDGRDRTLAEVLSRHGYASAGFVANLHYTSRDFGLDRGFVHFADYGFSPGELFLNTGLGRYLEHRRSLRRLLDFYDDFGRKHADRVNREILAWLGQGRSRPFFVFANYFDAHEPYLPPPEFEKRFASATPRPFFDTDQDIRGARRVLTKQNLTPAQVRRVRESYEAAIAALDDQVGRLLDTLRLRGLLRNTLVIVTSDHGEQFGRHGLFSHGNSIYRPVMKVPLVLYFPDHLPQGAVVHQRANLKDIGATILDLAGIKPDSAFPGTSLRELWDAPDTVEHPVFVETVSNEKAEIWRGALRGDAYYIRREGKEELYDLRADSAEVRNLADSAGWQGTLRSLRASLDSFLTVTGADRWGD